MKVPHDLDRQEVRPDRGVARKWRGPGHFAVESLQKERLKRRKYETIKPLTSAVARLFRPSSTATWDKCKAVPSPDTAPPDLANSSHSCHYRMYIHGHGVRMGRGQESGQHPKTRRQLRDSETHFRPAYADLARSSQELWRESLCQHRTSGTRSADCGCPIPAATDTYV